MCDKFFEVTIWATLVGLLGYIIIIIIIIFFNELLDV